MKHLILTIPAATVLGFLYLAGASAAYTGNYGTPLAGWHPVRAAVPFPGPKGSPIVLTPVKEAKVKHSYVKMAQGRIEIKTNMTNEEIAANLEALWK